MGTDKTHMIVSAGWGEYIYWLFGRRKRFVVREKSMVPTLMPGDVVLADMGAEVQAGDIAIVRWPGAKNSEPEYLHLSPDLLLIKRVDNIFYDGGAYLISDNVNEPSARDSRHFGVVSANQIVGRVTSRLATTT